MPNTRPRCIVIGIGNPDRADDAAGRAVVRRLHGTLPPEVEIVEHDGEATSLLACLEGAEMAFLIDACASAAPAGTVRRFDVSVMPLPHGTFNLSTHGFGLAEAIELARALGQLPSRCIVYAIEAGSFEAGDPLSPPVAVAISDVGEQVRAEISDADAPGSRIDA